MEWTAFFKSRPAKYGSIAGTLGFAVGAGASTFTAFMIASQCSSAIHLFLSQLSENVVISELTADIHFKNYTQTITLNNINMALPKGWIDIINHANEVPHYCFYSTFTLGLCLTMASSLALASAVMVSTHIHDEQIKQDEIDERYSLMA